jgi:hypothetical protein
MDDLDEQMLEVNDRRPVDDLDEQMLEVNDRRPLSAHQHDAEADAVINVDDSNAGNGGPVYSNAENINAGNGINVNGNVDNGIAGNGNVDIDIIGRKRKVQSLENELPALTLNQPRRDMHNGPVAKRPRL